MPNTEYRGRRAVCLENERVRVTALVEGGHIAEILDKRSGVNPLWTPPWPTMEPSSFDPARDTQYGTDAEAKLLSGIMGHNVCIDLFGGPSPEEAAAGMTVHGEASVNAYEVQTGDAAMTMQTVLKAAQLRFERRLRLDADTVSIEETVENLGATDRPIAWTQHVTLGPPFVQGGVTQTELTATRSKCYDSEFGENFVTGGEFDWPFAPARTGGQIDLRTYTEAANSAGFTTHLMDPSLEDSWFVVTNQQLGVAFGYRWKREDFPWCGIWEENRYRTNLPWNGQTITRGMEFGVSPMPEPRRRMIDRGGLFGVPGYRWIPARTRVTVAYEARVAGSTGGDSSAFWNHR